MRKHGHVLGNKTFALGLARAGNAFLEEECGSQEEGLGSQGEEFGQHEDTQVAEEFAARCSGTAAVGPHGQKHRLQEESLGAFHQRTGSAHE